MIKIAAVTAHFPNPNRPTDGRVAYETLRELSHRADVRVFCPSGVTPSLFHLPSKNHNRSFTPPPDLNATYYHYPVLPMVSRPINGWMAARALLTHVRDFEPDLILSYCIYPDAFAALRIGKALSVPVVAGGVGSDVHSIGDPISAMHSRVVLRDADFVFMVSDDLRNRAVSLGALPEKTRAILCGCDVSVFHPMSRVDARRKLQVDPGSNVVVYIGRMDLKKGLRELVDAAVALHPKKPDLSVYLVGEGPDGSIIDSSIRSKCAMGYIHLLPACTFKDVAVWMAAADLVTLPSYMEGCPNVVLEALACGRPVVATNVGGIPEIMHDDCGQLVPPRNVTELASALASVLERTWDAESISSRRSRSWSGVASELLEIFEFLVATRKAPIHAR